MIQELAGAGYGDQSRMSRCVVSLSKRHLLPKSTGNTQK